MPSKTLLGISVFKFLDWDQHLGSSLPSILVPLGIGKEVSILGLCSPGGQFAKESPHLTSLTALCSDCLRS